MAATTARAPKIRDDGGADSLTELHAALPSDQRGNHLSRPQREGKLKLQRILLRHRLIDPPDLRATQFLRSDGDRLGFQGIPASGAVHGHSVIPSYSPTV